MKLKEPLMQLGMVTPFGRRGLLGMGPGDLYVSAVA